MGVNLTKANKSAEAEAAYRKAIELDPKFAQAYSNLGTLLSDNPERSAEAEDAYRKAIELDPKLAAAYSNLGNLLNDNPERSAEAEAAYRKAIELDPKYAAAYSNLGNLLGKDPERSAEAEAAYCKAIELDPKYAAAWNGLGILYNLQKEYQKALQAYQNAVELAPKRATYRASLVAALRRLAYDEEADQQTALARELMQGESEYNQACLEAICDNREEALRLLEIALEKKQVTLEWARRDPDFESLRDNPRYRSLVQQEPDEKGM